MKLNQMKVFREIMLTRSVSEAAKNLHRSQPAVSAAISTLEDELGLKLFERRKGRLHPVSEAHYLLEECSEVLTRVDLIQRHITNIKSLESGKLQIVSMPGPSVFLLPDMISTFSEEKQDIQFDLISRSSDLVFQLIAAQQYDIGISDHFEGKLDQTSLVNAQVFKFECYCALRKDDPLAAHEVITPKLLNGKPLGLLYEEHESHENVVNAFKQENASLNARIKTRYFIPLLTFAEKNMSYAIVDPIAIESYRLYRKGNEVLTFRPFRPEVIYTTSILRPVHRPTSLISEVFLEDLVERFKAIGGQMIA